EVRGTIDDVDLRLLRVPALGDEQVAGERMHAEPDRIAEPGTEHEGLTRKRGTRPGLRGRCALDREAEELAGVVRRAVVGARSRRVDVGAEADVRAERRALA